MATALQKQVSNVSQSTSKSGPEQSMPISDNVIVLEKEFKSKKGHSGDIECITRLNETEFLSCSLDQSFKVWDKDLQGCSYTYETE